MNRACCCTEALSLASWSARRFLLGVLGITCKSDTGSEPSSNFAMRMENLKEVVGRISVSRSLSSFALIQYQELTTKGFATCEIL